jgi:HAT1-interacting factor 1
MHLLPSRVAHYGELAPECANTYFKYGAALLYKYQEESDPLGSVPKNAPNEESMRSTTGKNDSESSEASGSNGEDAASSEKVVAEEGKLFTACSFASLQSMLLTICISNLPVPLLQ